MKKIILLFIISLLLFKPGYSQQSFCPAGATWYYGIEWFAEYGYAKRSFVKDTTINGYAGQKLKEVDHTINQQFFTHQTDSSYLYFYENAGVVYGSYNIATTAFDTLYNFNAVPGDKWGLLQPSSCGDTAFIRVTDTGVITLNNHLLKFKKVNFAGGLYEFTDTLVEQIGFLHLDPFHEDICLVDGISYGFCSYKDSSFTTYPHADSICTLLPDGIKELNSDNSFLIYPNPGHDLIIIHSNGLNTPTEIHVFDVEGRIILSKEINQKADNSIDVSQFTGGMYFVEIKSNTVIKQTLFVKE